LERCESRVKIKGRKKKKHQVGTHKASPGAFAAELILRDGGSKRIHFVNESIHQNYTQKCHLAKPTSLPWPLLLPGDRAVVRAITSDERDTPVAMSADHLSAISALTVCRDRARLDPSDAVP
jgi:hypothetical protein